MNQAAEVHVTSIKVSSVLPSMLLKDWALCHKPISGDRTLIHYLPCKVPSSHSIRLHFMNGRAGTMRLKEGSHFLDQFLLLRAAFDWDNFFSDEWCTVYQHYGPCFGSDGKMLERLLWNGGAVSVSFGCLLTWWILTDHNRFIFLSILHRRAALKWTLTVNDVYFILKLILKWTFIKKF